MTDEEMAKHADAVWENLRVQMALSPPEEREAMAMAAVSFALDLLVADRGIEATRRYLRAAADELHEDYPHPEGNA